MRKVQMSSFDEMMANMYQVETGVKGHGSGVAGFPRSHDGLEKAIKLAFDEGSCVTFKGEVVWEDSMKISRRVFEKINPYLRH